MKIPFGFLLPQKVSGGVNYDPVMSLRHLSNAVGADGGYSRLVSCFQSKNKWRAWAYLKRTSY